MVCISKRLWPKWRSIFLCLCILSVPSLSAAQDGRAELHTIAPSSYSHWYGGGILDERQADSSFPLARNEVLGSQFSCEDFVSLFLVVNGQEGINDQELSIQLGLETRSSLAGGASLTLGSLPTFNVSSYRLLGNGQIETVNDPAHRADEETTVHLIERRLLPPNAMTPSDADEEEVSLLVSDIDDGEQLVIRLKLKLSCATQSRPRGELSTYIKKITDSSGTELSLSADSTVKISGVEGIQGLEGPLLSLQSIAQLGDEACPSLTEVRDTPSALLPLREETQMTLCHYILNRGVALTSALRLMRIDDSNHELLAEIDSLATAEAEIIVERVTVNRSSRLVTQVSSVEEIELARSQIFIPFITPNDADGDGLSDSDELRLGTDLFSIDSDDDGLSDLEEFELGSPPTDADADDDGLLDGLEGSIEAIFNHDTDGDGIYDGTERGITEPGPDTDLSKEHFRPDLDPDTTSDHLSADSDGGGCSDREEDPNLNGRFDTDESDINNADDDKDDDLDGLYNVRERFLGSDERDADSDDDGLIDGNELLPEVDTDGDGLTTINDPDSDNDGLSDGLELGISRGETHNDTNLSLSLFTPDLDPSTTTDPFNADSDGGGISDGEEDRNQNGRVDRLETDPLLGRDDQPDQDGDLIPNGFDNCPELANSDQEDLDGDGQGDLCDEDVDGDGIFDGLTPQRSQGCAQDSSAPSSLILLFFAILLMRLRQSLNVVLISFLTVTFGLAHLAEALPLDEQRDFALDLFESDFQSGVSPGLLSAKAPQTRWGLSANQAWSYRPLVLSIEHESQSAQKVASLIDQRVDSLVSLWSRLGERWLFALSLPLVLSQERDRLSNALPTPTISEPLSDLSGQAFGDLKLSLRYFAPLTTKLNFAIDASLSTPTSTRHAYAGDPNVRGGLGLVLAYNTSMARLNVTAKHSIRSLVNVVGHQRQDLTQVGVGSAFRVASFREDNSAQLWSGLSLIGQSDMASRVTLQGGDHHSLSSLFHIDYEDHGYTLQMWGARALWLGLTTAEWRAGVNVRVSFERLPWQADEIIVNSPPPPPPIKSEQSHEEIISEAINDLDTDHDGLLNDIDFCPAQKGTLLTQGCPKHDMDGDGVANKSDACLWTKGDLKNLGCPLGELAIPFKLRKHFIFTFGATRLKQSQTKELKKIVRIAKFLTDHPNILIHLSGHTDYKGYKAYNRKVSRLRVYHIKKRLITEGVNPAQIEISAFGENEPIVYDSLHTQRIQNRRVTVTYSQSVSTQLQVQSK
jgi:outer membrane protein OmpA-like peptidoglycan-associated protein